jgi:hypothetical protein
MLNPKMKEDWLYFLGSRCIKIGAKEPIYYRTNLSINQDGSININGNLHYSIELTPKKFPVKFHIVNGYFCCNASQLDTLENLPDIITCHITLQQSKFTREEIRKVCNITAGVYFQ